MHELELMRPKQVPKSLASPSEPFGPFNTGYVGISNPKSSQTGAEQVLSVCIPENAGISQQRVGVKKKQGVKKKNQPN